MEEPATQYHEPVSELSERDQDYHRALVSLKEEVEAIDWYQQRVSGSTDESLEAILAHNRDEEIEHAAMVIEWLRRNMPGWNEMLERYLFKKDSIVSLEPSAKDSAPSLEIGRIEASTRGGS